MKAVVLMITALSLINMCCTNTLARDFTAQQESEKPNIVIVISEDMSPRIGAYGDEVAHTPNLDQLAQEGILFTNVYTMAGVCAPSRASLITGAPPHRTGLQHMRTADQKYIGVPPANVKAYPELLRKKGYFTYNDVKTDYQFVKGVVDIGPFTIWSANGDVRNPKDSLLPSAWREHDLQNKPFFINLNPFITHESALFMPDRTPEYLRGMNHISAAIRSNYTFKTPKLDSIKVPPYLVDSNQTRAEIARFYENIDIMDQQVGSVISNLKADGLWDNTIFIFTTDHGDALPRSKREGLVSGIKVPMIVHIPEKYKPDWMPDNGDHEGRLVSFEDLAPTILGFAGVERLPYMQGHDLSKNAPTTREYIYADRARMDSADLRSYFVMDNNFQYVRNYSTVPNGSSIGFRNILSSSNDLNEGNKNHTLTAIQAAWFTDKADEELYDLSQDPNQLVNIANNPKYKSVLNRFRDELDNWRNQGTDLNLIDEQTLIKDLANNHGEQQKTLPPVAEIDQVTGKLFITPRTSGASIGYSYDQQVWQVYDRSFIPNKKKKTLYIKSVRYGWQESNIVEVTF